MTTFAPDITPIYSTPEPESLLHRHRTILLVVGAGLVIALLAAFGVAQHAAATSAHQALTRTQHDLAVSREDMGRTEDELAATKADLDARSADLDAMTKVLASCTSGIAVGRALSDAVHSLVDARGVGYYSQLPYLEDALASVKRANQIAEDEGYADVEALFSACEQAPTRSNPNKV